jgi:hypothetical protein
VSDQPGGDPRDREIFDHEGVEDAATLIRDAAFRYVEDAQGVRVEDYLTTLAALTGEAAFVSAGAVDIEAAPIAAGRGVFGPPIDAVLSGDTTDLAVVPPFSVAGLLRDGLAGHVVPLEVLDLERVVRHVAANVGKAPWGGVVLSVPPDNRPHLLPIRVAFELRPVVIRACQPLTPNGSSLVRGRHVPCALALVSAVEQVVEAIDPVVAVTIAFEVTFTMAKMMPMSMRQMQELAE